MPSPKSESRPACPNLALAPVGHHNTQVTAVQLVAYATIVTVVTFVEVPFEPVTGILTQPDTGPPGLYLLNSALLV